MSAGSILRRRVAAFGYALRGGWTLLRSTPHAQFHARATITAVGLGLWAALTPGEWALLALAIGAVWTAEALNTALELLADELTLERRERLKHAKDIAAFAVLVAALAALAVGAALFLPRLWRG